MQPLQVEPQLPPPHAPHRHAAVLPRRRQQVAVQRAKLQRAADGAVGREGGEAGAGLEVVQQQLAGGAARRAVGFVCAGVRWAVVGEENSCFQQHPVK